MTENMTSEEQQHQNGIAILKELSDIKAALAVNTKETENIKGTIGEIKVDIKEIKSDFVNRREFNDTIVSLRKESEDANKLIKQEFVDAIKSVKEDIAIPKKIIYGGISFILIAVLGAMIGLVLIEK